MFKELNTLKIFFESPTREFSGREVAKILRKAPASTISHLKSLVKEGFVKFSKDRYSYIYKANLDSQKFMDLKLFYNIQKLRNSGFVEELNKFYLKPTILLFGSAFYGLDVEDSDFDLVIVSEKKKDFSALHDFEKKINRKIHLFVVKSIKELKNEHLINNVLNGIVIQGEIKWI